MKSLLISALIATASIAGTASAATISIGQPGDYAFSSRDIDWDQNVESESAQVIKGGAHFNYNVDGGATPWGSGTWLYNGYVEVTFTVPADTLVIQFQADANDGVAEFIVDGVSLGTYNTNNGGWFPVVISGLSNTTHTLRVNRLSADLAFDNFGAVSTAVVPVPAGAPLLISALGALGAVRCRRAASGV
ncbi:MAG: VPLPA-CTERM sorting domain-containing protein [Pseudomonadota bacterium]